MAVAGAIVALVVAFILLGGSQVLSLGWLKAQQAALVAQYHATPVRFIAGFVAAQAIALALMTPGAVGLFALAGGAILGPWVGIATILCAVTLGDSLGFLVARYLVRDWAARRFGTAADRFARGMERGGAYVLLSLRLAAVVPYFVVNIAMALTRMRLRTFAPVSFIGLIPATVLHVNAGVQLARVERPSDILTWPVIAAFTTLAVFPLLMRWAVRRSAGEVAR